MVGTVIKVTKMKQLYFLIGIYLFLVIIHLKLNKTIYYSCIKTKKVTINHLIWMKHSEKYYIFALQHNQFGSKSHFFGYYPYLCK